MTEKQTQVVLSWISVIASFCLLLIQLLYLQDVSPTNTHGNLFVSLIPNTVALLLASPCSYWLFTRNNIKFNNQELTNIQDKAILGILFFFAAVFFVLVYVAVFDNFNPGQEEDLLMSLKSFLLDFMPTTIVSLIVIPFTYIISSLAYKEQPQTSESSGSWNIDKSSLAYKEQPQTSESSGSWNIDKWIDKLVVSKTENTDQYRHKEETDWTLLPLADINHLVWQKRKNWLDGTECTLKAYIKINNDEYEVKDICKREIQHGSDPKFVEWMIWFQYKITKDQGEFQIRIETDCIRKTKEYRCQIFRKTSQFEMRIEFDQQDAFTQRPRLYLQSPRHGALSTKLDLTSGFDNRILFSYSTNTPLLGGEYTITWN